MPIDAFPADAALPQLQIAGDPKQMREIFRRHLRPGAGECYEIQECRLARVRYRRAERCVLQYTLRLVAPESGDERSQWVTGVLYAGDRTGRIWQKRRAAEPEPEIPAAFRTFEPVCFIPELGMLVEVFPYDRRLPTLPRLLAGPPPEVQPLLVARFGAGDWRAETWRTDPIRYRGELGVVLRYTVEAREANTGRRAEQRFYAKVYGDEKAGAQTHQVLQALWQRSSAEASSDRAPSERFTVGRPIAYLRPLCTLIQEESPGTALTEILLRGAARTLAVRRVARALAALHLEPVAGARLHHRQDEVALLQRTGKLLRWACPHLGPAVDAIIGGIAEGLTDAPPAPTHRDLKADHILLEEERLALLDLDYFAAADPVLDAAAMLAQLACLPFQVRGWDVDRPLPDRAELQQAFAEEYFARVPTAWRSRLPFHYAGALLKEAVGCFRRQEPHWPETIASLVQEARVSFAGRVR